MLDHLFPRVHRRYTSLPVLGRTLGDFASWLFALKGDRHLFRLKIEECQVVTGREKMPVPLFGADSVVGASCATSPAGVPTV